MAHCFLLLLLFFLSGSVKDLISFLFMCVLTLAGAEKKKIAVPRCFEAALAYIQMKLRRKNILDKKQPSHMVFYSIFNKPIMFY